MTIRIDDEVYVMRTCTECNGNKTIPGSIGGASPCTKCDARGKELVPVTIKELAAVLKQVISKLPS